MKIIFLIDTENFSAKFWVVLKILQVINSPKYVGITENYLCFHRVRKAPRWSRAGYDVSLLKRMLLPKNIYESASKQHKEKVASYNIFLSGDFLGCFFHFLSIKIWLNPAVKKQAAPSFSPCRWNNMAAVMSAWSYECVLTWYLLFYDA